MVIVELSKSSSSASSSSSSSSASLRRWRLKGTREGEWRERESYSIQLKLYCECLRRSRWVSLSLSLFEARRCDFEWWCGGPFVTTGGIHKVGEDFCLLEKVFKPLPFVLFLQNNEGVRYLEISSPTCIIYFTYTQKRPVRSLKRRKTK